MKHARVPRVLIVSDHASLRFGGEAALPLHFFRSVRKLGAEAWLVVHERTREELTELLADDVDRIYFIEDTPFHVFLWKCGRQLPNRLAYFTFGALSRILTQRAAKRLVEKLVRDKEITVIHQPIPVSPKEPSMLYDLTVPIVMGPMNGGIDYPASFRHMQNRWVSTFVFLGRVASNYLNRLMPGKLKADVLLVANKRTLNALPEGVEGTVIEMTENGVDLSTWRSNPHTQERLETSTPTFVFMGRLVDWKAVDILLDAFSKVVEATRARLVVIGDGPLRDDLEAQRKNLGFSADQVQFTGWLSQAEAAAKLACADVLVLPSLMECGGAVVLEAMAMKKPVIATDWGGPADYLDANTGILVAPDSRARLTNGLAIAMKKLAAAPDLRRQMGENGKQRIRERYDWDAKGRQIINIYRLAIHEWETRENAEFADGATARH